MLLLEGRVVIVAGVGPALGSGLARRCAHHGADVVLVARTPERLEDVARQVEAEGRAAVRVVADVTDADHCARVVERAVTELGRVDVLVYNAFQLPPYETLDVQAIDVVRTSFEVNVFGALQLSQRVIPDMRTRADGAIVLVNSAILRQTRPMFGAYKMAKHAMLGFARNLAAEVGPDGIRVNSIAPSWIWGDVVEGHLRSSAAERGISYEDAHAEVLQGLALRRIPRPDEIADAAVFLSSPMASAITGQCLDVNAGEFVH